MPKVQKRADYHENDEDYAIWEAFDSYQDKDDFYFLQYFTKLGEDAAFRWGYYPPKEFKILLYFPDDGSFAVSDEVYERYAFDSYYTVDLSHLTHPVTNGETIRVEKDYHYAAEAGSSLPGPLSPSRSNWLSGCCSASGKKAARYTRNHESCYARDLICPAERHRLQPGPADVCTELYLVGKARICRRGRGILHHPSSIRRNTGDEKTGFGSVRVRCQRSVVYRGDWHFRSDTGCVLIRRGRQTGCPSASRTPVFRADMGFKIHETGVYTMISVCLLILITHWGTQRTGSWNR
jgi:hypothetical protein